MSERTGQVGGTARAGADRGREDRAQGGTDRQRDDQRRDDQRRDAPRGRTGQGGADRGGRGAGQWDRDRRPPRAARPAVDLPRQAAYEAIEAVHRDDAYANLVLPGILRDRRLHGRDAAFATELTYGTLRVRGTLDAILTAAAGRDVARIDPQPRDALRLGAYQILYTRVPAHAAVSSTVDLVRSLAPGAAGFTNAVLREVAGKDLDTWLAELAPSAETDPIGHLALTYSHPEWIVRAFSEALGGDLGETTRLLIEDNQRPPVHLCARPGRADAVEVADEVGGAPGAFSPYAVYLAGERRASWRCSPTAGRTSRTRAPNWWPPRSSPPRSRVPTNGGSTSVPGRVASPACSARSPPSGGLADRGRGGRAPGPTGLPGRTRAAGDRAQRRRAHRRA
ncbi:hypothetical protein GCM10027615_66290 [Plantactinospora veratri]